MNCFNPKVLVGVGVVALGVAVFAPGAFLAALPALVLLACPLSMVLMMRTMARGDRQLLTDTLDEHGGDVLGGDAVGTR